MFVSKFKLQPSYITTTSYNHADGNMFRLFVIVYIHVRFVHTCKIFVIVIIPYCGILSINGTWLKLQKSRLHACNM